MKSKTVGFVIIADDGTDKYFVTRQGSISGHVSNADIFASRRDAQYATFSLNLTNHEDVPYKLTVARLVLHL